MKSVESASVGPVMWLCSAFLWSTLASLICSEAVSPYRSCIRIPLVILCNRFWTLVGYISSNGSLFSRSWWRSNTLWRMTIIRLRLLFLCCVCIGSTWTRACIWCYPHFCCAFPLPYWQLLTHVGLSHYQEKLFGSSVWASRLPSAICGLGLLIGLLITVKNFGLNMSPSSESQTDESHSLNHYVPGIITSAAFALNLEVSLTLQSEHRPESCQLIWQLLPSTSRWMCWLSIFSRVMTITRLWSSDFKNCFRQCCPFHLSVGCMT